MKIRIPLGANALAVAQEVKVKTVLSVILAIAIWAMDKQFLNPIAGSAAALDVKQESRARNECRYTLTRKHDFFESCEGLNSHDS
ncbi:hypothetical protein LJC46_07140 [Desulfovibrio sp. OttesenSCG-928-G15]|nr:hypothetical protein [Desulfovibrio sp. OttesenSCG-928-G15]